MSKYTIVSKSCKGNKPNCVYTIEYQVEDKGTDIYKTDLLCLNKERYAFLDTNYSPFVFTSADRGEFLEEFYKFQKGASYRRTHPIRWSESEKLKQECIKLENELLALKNRARQAAAKEQAERFDRYRASDACNNEELNMFIAKLVQSLSSSDRYFVRCKEVFGFKSYLIICDKQQGSKPVGQIYISYNDVGKQPISDDFLAGSSV